MSSAPEEEFDRFKLVTCVVPKGMALPTLRALGERFAIVASNIASARGVGRVTPLARRGIGGQGEKEILTFVVDAERADEAFEFAFHEARVDHPHGGLVYMSRVDRATEFLLPELPSEE